MKERILAILLAFLLVLPFPRTAQADLFGGDGVPRNARV